MALTTGSQLNSADIVALKDRVKAEMGRRNATGSLASYNGNFTDPATAGSKIKASHYNETVGYIAKISAITGLTSSRAAGDLITEINAASTRLTSNEDRSKNHKTDNSTDCASSCTGLCRTACSGSCRGCSGSCTGSCTSCSGCSGCSSCSGSCSGTCSGCSGSCSGSCTSCDGCSGGCGNSCNWWCNAACWDKCTMSGV